MYNAGIPIEGTPAERVVAVPSDFDTRTLFGKDSSGGFLRKIHDAEAAKRNLPNANFSPFNELPAEKFE